MDRSYDFITFISRYFILTKPRVTDIFADINKIVTKFIKNFFKILKKS